MNHQKQFINACRNGNLTDITCLLQTYNINVHADNECGFRWACRYGHLNLVQYLLENNFNIDVHANDDEGFRWACWQGHLNVIKYLITKTKMTNKMMTILSKFKYFDKLKMHSCFVKIFNHKLRLYKFLFPLYNIINVENSIYFGII